MEEHNLKKLRSLCESGNKLINDLIQWMQSVQNIENVIPKTQESTDIMTNIAVTQE